MEASWNSNMQNDRYMLLLFAIHFMWPNGATLPLKAFLVFLIIYFFGVSTVNYQNYKTATVDGD